jgi:succinate dehydrogenase / fumarate reductase flavoprotein subunit
MDPNWRKVNLVCALDGGEVKLTHQPVPPMRADLLALFDRTEMSKYLTEEEMAVYDEAVAAGKAGN